MNFSSGPFFVGLALSAGVIALLIAVTYAIGLATQRHRVMDVAWGLGFVLVAVASFAFSSGHGDVARRVLVLVLVAAWGLRLSIHIARRNAGRGEDPRYAAMLERRRGHPALVALLVIYLPQGVVMWFVALPLEIAMYERGGFDALDAIGAVLALVGITFEAVGDAQLARFLASDEAREGVMDRGLWRYTRHPNYFGDACLWWGVFVIAAGRLPGVATILSPILMNALLVRGTGKALLEKTIGERRPGYRAYVEATSGFFPLPPRRRPQ